MKKLHIVCLLLLLCAFLPQNVFAYDSTLTRRLSGTILLQVEDNGEAWYVDPVSLKRYYLKNGEVAYEALRKFGLGITNADLNKIPVGVESRFSDTDSDSDGLADQLEEGLKTDPKVADTDNDGVSDGVEVLQKNTNPLGSGNLIYNYTLINRLKGRIMLQVEANGEAWYLNPEDGKRYYMKDGDAAYQIMRFLSLGITNADLEKIESGTIETEADNTTDNNPVTAENQVCLDKYGENSYADHIDVNELIICYCKDGYDWAKLVGTEPNNCIPESQVKVDSDGDGLYDQYDINPNGGGRIITKIYYPYDYLNQVEYTLEFGISSDYYHYYTQILTHDFYADYSNLADFVTYYDPTIIEIADKFLITQTEDPDSCMLCAFLDFVQTFDYIDDYTTGYDEFPKYPVETLMDGNGDCEDTSYLTAAILKAMGMDVVLIEFVDHVAVGVAMPDDWEGTYYEYNGTKYFFLETTGEYEIGELPEDLAGEEVIIHPII